MIKNGIGGNSNNVLAVLSAGYRIFDINNRPSWESWDSKHSCWPTPELHWGSKSHRHVMVLLPGDGIAGKICCILVSGCPNCGKKRLTWARLSCKCGFRPCQGRSQAILLLAMRQVLWIDRIDKQYKREIYAIPNIYIIASTIGAHAAPMLRP